MMIGDPITPEERDASVREATGVNWREVDERYSMPCGGCRGGMLRLHCVRHVLTLGWVATQVALTLRCDTCDAELTMPLHGRE